MHGAPSVDYPVGRSRFLLAIIGCLLAAGGVLTAAWFEQARVDGPRIAAGVAALVLASGASFRWWLRCPQGTLAWDGAAWHWSDTQARAEQHPLVAIDFQSRLLLHWPAGPMPRWLWLERATAPQRWDDLRRAVYSRARPDARVSASPP